MQKYKKASIVITALIIILMFIPTFCYSEEHFGFHLDLLGEGVSYNSRGITDYNESVATLGINGDGRERCGFFIILSGIALILIAIFLKSALSRFVLLAGICFSIIGSVVQIIYFYSQPHSDTREINQPPYIAFALIIIELLLIMISIKNSNNKAA